jgi:hypothetical protein
MSYGNTWRIAGRQVWVRPFEMISKWDGRGAWNLRRC